MGVGGTTSAPPRGASAAPRGEQSARGRRRERLRQRAEQLAARAASALVVGASHGVRWLPSGARYLPADAITTLVGRVWRRRAIVAANFAAALGLAPDDPRARALAQTSLRNFGRMAIDFLTARTMSGEELRRAVTPVGEQYLAEALMARRGVIFAMPHLGSWDVSAAYAPAYGIRVTVVLEGHMLARIVEGARTYEGVTLAPLDRSMRVLFHALRRNEAVVLLSDIAPAHMPTVDVPFFDRPAAFASGPARLALRTGAPIMVVCCVRLPDGGFRAEALPPIWPDATLPEDEGVRTVTAAVAQDFSRMIERYPEHWYPFHRVWADVPPR